MAHRLAPQARAELDDIWDYITRELAQQSRLPAIYPYPPYAEHGALMTYTFDPVELARQVADDVHRVLHGAKPGDIPIYQSTRFKLTLNLKAARALGITFPPEILARADEVTE